MILKKCKKVPGIPQICRGEKRKNNNYIIHDTAKENNGGGAVLGLYVYDIFSTT